MRRGRERRTLLCCGSSVLCCVELFEEFLAGTAAADCRRVSTEVGDLVLELFEGGFVVGDESLEVLYAFCCCCVYCPPFFRCFLGLVACLLDALNMDVRLRGMG